MWDLEKVVCCYDFDSLMPDGSLKDFGPHALHAIPGPGGAAPTRRVGYYTFNGAVPEYCTLPLRFYDYAPRATWTAIWYGWHTSDAAKDWAMIFSCLDNNAGAEQGIGVGLYEDTVTAAVLFQAQGAVAPIPYLLTPALEPFLKINSAMPVSLNMEAPSGVPNIPPPLGSINSFWTVPTFPVGTYGPANYDTAVTPRIGCNPDGSDPLNAALSYFLLYDGAMTALEHAAVTMYLRNGIKPFCMG